MLDKTQKQLHEQAGVSKKSINDFENEYVILSPKKVLALRTALEGWGAVFLHGKDAVAVALSVGSDGKGGAGGGENLPMRASGQKSG